MRQRHVFQHLITVLLCVVVVGASLSFPAVSQAQSGNLLSNPGFEGNFVAAGGNPSLTVAESWQPWFVERTANDPSSVNAQPEYKPAEDFRIRSGNGAQSYGTFFATHTGGIFQRIAVQPGQELQFSVFVYVWSSATFANRDVSEDPNDVIVNVGIDPTGGTDGTSANIVWSTDAEYYDEYRQLSVTAISQSTAVTVFVKTAPQGFVGTNSIYVDDAALIPLGAAPTLTPVPSLTPAPTTLPEPTIEGPTPVTTLGPLPTITPAQTLPAQPTAPPNLPGNYNDTVLYTVVAGDTVWGIAQRYESSIDAIIEVNGLNSTGFLSIGQTLVVPINTVYTQPPTFTPVPTLSGGSGGPVNPGVITYTVQAGDTLTTIAQRTNTTVATLAQINNIVNPHLILPGQVLQIPGAAPAPVPVPATPTPMPLPQQPSQQPGTHVVQPGENLFRIALKYNMTWDVIARANSIYYPNFVFPGQVLVIPQ